MKYDKLIDMEYEASPLVEGENLIWKGKPKKKCFILSNIFTMLPFALPWLIFDVFFIVAFMTNMDDEMKKMIPFFVIFFAFHLMPVWMWLSSILTANRRWKNTEYYITDKRIIIKNGLVSGNYETVYYKDIETVNIHVGITDKMFGVGDLMINSKHGNVSFLDIEDAKEVYPKLQKIVLDIQTDIEYPNAFRPKSNPGYNTTLETDETK